MKFHSFKVVGRHVRLYWANVDTTKTDLEGTTWPWPFGKIDLHQDAAWKARYAPDTLTKAEAMELADIANAYTTLITHPARSLRTTIHVLHRAYEKWRREEP